jgi:hypothetical protein
MHRRCVHKYTIWVPYLCVNIIATLAVGNAGLDLNGTACLVACVIHILKLMIRTRLEEDLTLGM